MSAPLEVLPNNMQRTALRTAAGDGRWAVMIGEYLHMKCRIVAVIAASFGVTTALWAQDYQPVECKDTRPYQGAAIYGKQVALPVDGYAMGRAFDNGVRERLDLAIAEAARHTKATHITGAIATREAMWSATRSSREGVPPRRFYWASVGKAFTAVVIMQLVDEGKLNLDDSISRWVHGVPNGDVITVDHLLQHTSGLFSANEDLKYRKAPRYLTPEQTLRISARHGAMFCPGQAWRYSNTGYSVLGQIIEAVDGRPYHEAVNERIARRLELSTLQALAPKASPPDVAPLTPADGSEPLLSPSWAFAAGAVVGTSEDMLRFWSALLAAKLVSTENTKRLFDRLYPMFDAGTYYGRGVMLYEVPQRDGTVDTWLGHSGGMPGAKAVIAYSTARRVFLAAALSGDGSAEAAANLLLQQLAEPK